MICRMCWKCMWGYNIKCVKCSETMSQDRTLVYNLKRIQWSPGVEGFARTDSRLRASHWPQKINTLRVQLAHHTVSLLHFNPTRERLPRPQAAAIIQASRETTCITISLLNAGIYNVNNYYEGNNVARNCRICNRYDILKWILKCFLSLLVN